MQPTAEQWGQIVTTAAPSASSGGNDNLQNSIAVHQRGFKEAEGFRKHITYCVTPLHNNEHVSRLPVDSVTHAKQTIQHHKE